MMALKSILAWFALALVLLIAGVGWLFMQMAGWLYALFDDWFSR